MDYINIDFPHDLSLCFSGGCEFLTSNIILKNKKEIRNQIWEEPRYRYSLIYRKCSEKIYQKLNAFFLLCCGKKKSFNFLDKGDFEINYQQIGVGDGTTKNFEIFKNYAYENFSFKRKIFKTKNEKVYINNTPVDNNLFQIENGLLSFKDNFIPKKDDIIFIDCIFYVIVRFDLDYLPIIRNNNMVELPEIVLVETKNN